MSTSDHFAASELARLCAAKGVTHAIISPGSRSAPLVIAFDQQESIQCHVVIDERSAGFVALGIAQQLGRPVALICTSGSAVLNYGPAIAEAFYQRIPLLVISADRPEEWVDQGEGQAIRQHGALSLHVHRSIQLPRADHDDLSRWHCARAINEALDACLLPAPGPVHVNVPFAEPLYGTRTEQEKPGSTIMPVPTESFIRPEHAERLVQAISNSERVLLIVGQGVWDPSVREGLRRLAALPQIIVLTEATSNLDDAMFLTCIDRVIEGITVADAPELRPGLLISFGGAVVSKRIKGLLREWHPAQHWHIDPAQRHFDTYQSLTHDIAVDPAMFLAQIADQVKANESGYKALWQQLEHVTKERHESFLKEAPFTDLIVYRDLLRMIPENSDIHVANSTPARYVQLFDRDHRCRYFSNRGTSGIDGCTSTAVGASLVAGRPTTLITGDVAFCYDSNAFWNRLPCERLRIIVMDNGGGNIFRYIQGPDKDPALLPYFETPHHRDPVALARSFGLPCYEAFDPFSLKQALKELYADTNPIAVLVVRTDGPLSAATLRRYFQSLRG